MGNLISNKTTTMRFPPSMKTFREWLKQIPPIVVNVVPVHGTHATPHDVNNGPVRVGVIPTHGSHSSRLTENLEPTDAEYKKVSDDANRRHTKGTALHHVAVRSYTQKSYPINSSLLRGHFDDDGRQQTAKDLDHETEKEYGHEHTLYHGCGRDFNPGKFASKHPERHIKLPAFTSTSVNKKMATGFADTGYVRHILHIHMKATDKGHPILHRSSIGNEHEVLLPRNTVLKVRPHSDKERIPNGELNHIIYHHWHADIVSQHREPLPGIKPR